jgi:ribosomal protein S27AE
MSIEKNIFRILEEIKKSEELISEAIILSESSAFSPPLNKLQVTSGFCPRWGKHHDGVDLSAVDEPVKSLADGTVIATHNDKYPCGGTIMIKHSDGYTTGFCHMQKINVKVGQEVKKGDVIGISGGGKDDPGKGRSSGKHLHLTIRKDGKPLDPMKFIDKEGVLVGTVPLSPTSGTDLPTDSTIVSNSNTPTKQKDTSSFGSDEFDFLTGNIPGNMDDFDFIKGIKERKITENIKRIKNLL